MADLEVSLFGQPLDKGVDQPKGNIQIPGQISLARNNVIVELFQDF
jgi:hypothetical protein